MKKNSNIFVAVFVFLCAVSACNFVEIDQEVVEDGSVGIGLKWSWTGVEKGRPDSMNVVYGRLINAQLDSTVRGVFLSPSDKDTALVLKNGEYYLLTFGLNDTLYRPVMLEDFDTSISVSMKEIGLKMKTLRFQEVIGDTLSDYNDGIPFIKDAGTIYTSLNVQTLSPDHMTDVMIEPKNITGNISLVFPVLASKDVKINYMKAYVSGMVGFVHPMTGIVNYNDLYRQQLELSLDTLMLGDTSRTTFYKAHGNILGIFPPKDSAIVTGPGVMNIIIDASSRSGRRKYYRARNLSEYIKEQEIMQVHPDFSGYYLAKDTVRIEIRDSIRIGTLGNDGDGVNVWIDNELFIDREF